MSLSSLSRIRTEFEHIAFGYGISPQVCTLLGEHMSQEMLKLLIQTNKKIYGGHKRELV